MSEPHPRWSRANDEHGRRVKEMLYDIIEGSARKKLTGGVEHRDVVRLPLYDTLDLAQEVVKRGGHASLAAILDEIRTPGT